MTIERNGSFAGAAAGVLVAAVEATRVAFTPAHRHLSSAVAAAAFVALAVYPLAGAIAGALLAPLLRRSRMASAPVARVVLPAGLLAAAVAGLLALRPVRLARRSRASRPNILLITVDALRADAVGALGAGPGATPELDRMAREGALFTRAQSASSWTLPSIASIQTGRFVPGHGVSSRRPVLPPGVPTVATRLAGCGYATGAVVSSTFTRSAFGFDHGFDVYDEEISPDWKRLLAPRAVHRLGLFRTALARVDERNAAETVDAAERLMGGRSPEPFFVWLHLFDPHPPYAPPAPWGSAARAAVRSPWDGRIGPLVEVGDGRRAPPSRAEVERLRALYAAEVAYADHEIGRLRAFLESRGLWERTAVVVTADHGDAFLEHGRLVHGDVYQEILRVPLLVRYPPRVPAGARVDAVVRTVDVAPTLTHLAGCEAAWPDGEDLLPLVGGGGGGHRAARADQDAHEEELLVRRTRRALLVWPEKLILSGDAPPELYDLSSDPGETRNLAPEAPSRVDALARRLPPPPVTTEEPATRLAPPWVRQEIRERLRSLGYLR